MKRINDRQWWHRLTRRKCWNCNVALERVNDLDGHRCPMCLTFYSETVIVAWETKSVLEKAERGLADAERIILASGASGWVGTSILRDVRSHLGTIEGEA